MPIKTKTAMADKAAPPLIAADLLKRLIPGPMPDASGATGGPVPTVQEGLHRMHWSRPVNQRPSYASGQANPEGAGSGASNRRLTTQLIAALQIAPPHPLDAGPSLEWPTHKGDARRLPSLSIFTIAEPVFLETSPYTK